MPKQLLAEEIYYSIVIKQSNNAKQFIYEIAIK